VILGVGLTIGSVPPDDETNCVRNITYRRITQTSPIKGIYVKVSDATARSSRVHMRSCTVPLAAGSHTSVDDAPVAAAQSRQQRRRHH